MNQHYQNLVQKLEEIVIGLLEANPAHRIPSAEELKKALCSI